MRENTINTKVKRLKASDFGVFLRVTLWAEWY